LGTAYGFKKMTLDWVVASRTADRQAHDAYMDTQRLSDKRETTTKRMKWKCSLLEIGLESSRTEPRLSSAENIAEISLRYFLC
jgi:hypothetical protein